MDAVEAEDKEARSYSPLDCVVVTYEWLVVLQGFSQWSGCLHASYMMTFKRASFERATSAFIICKRSRSQLSSWLPEDNPPASRSCEILEQRFI